MKVHLTSGRTTRLASNLSRYSETNRRVEHLRCAGPSVRGVQYSVHSHGNKGVLRRLLLCGGVSRRGFCSCRPAPVLDRSQILLIQRNRAFGRDGERRGGTHVLRWVRRLGRRASPITTAATMAARAMTNPRIPDECRYRRVSTGGARCWVETARRLPGVNEANSLTKTGTSNTEKSDPQRHE